MVWPTSGSKDTITKPSHLCSITRSLLRTQNADQKSGKDTETAKLEEVVSRKTEHHSRRARRSKISVDVVDVCYKRFQVESSRFLLETSMMVDY
jgi:hypothetical protein